MGLTAACFAAWGCVGTFADVDGTSAGHHSDGAILGSVALPFEGTGYEIPAGWRPRNANYTTLPVLRWLVDGFAAAAALEPGTVAQVGDLSERGGGPIRRHGSHESGRDVDIFLVGADERGAPFRSQAGALRYRADGRAYAWSPAEGPPRALGPVPPVRFDPDRTWVVLRSLVANRSVEVQWIFIHRELGAQVIAAGRTRGEDPSLVDRVAALLHQPRDGDPHDDHFHVRVFCDPRDRSACVDRGPQRWWKKRWKYLARP